MTLSLPLRPSSKSAFDPTETREGLAHSARGEGKVFPERVEKHSNGFNL